MSTKSHQKRGHFVDIFVHEMSPKVSTRCHPFCPRNVAYYVHEMSATRESNLLTGVRSSWTKPLPTPCSTPKNQGTTEVLPVLPTTAPLLKGLSSLNVQQEHFIHARSGGVAGISALCSTFGHCCLGGLWQFFCRCFDVLSSCGFQLCGFHLTTFSKSSPNIKLIPFSLMPFWYLSMTCAADFCQT